MTLRTRRNLLKGAAAFAALAVARFASAQDKPADGAPGACASTAPVKVTRNKRTTGGKTQANRQCFPPGTPLDQVEYESTRANAVFTDTANWERCAHPTPVTVRWTVRGLAQNGKAPQAERSTALWWNGEQIRGSAHSVDALKPNESRTFTQVLTKEETAKGRVSLIAHGVAVLDLVVIAF